MRTYLLILSLLLIHCFANAQKIRFTDTVNSWKIEYSRGWPIFYSYEQRYFDGIVIQNANSYTKIKNLGLCREDTVQHKVYIISPYDTTERLLYDYNMQVGDTLAYYFYGGAHNPSGVVVQKDSILIAGNYYQKWELRNLAPYVYSTTIIEGIGVVFWSTFEQARKTICFQRNGVIIPVGYYVTSSTCALAVNNINPNNDIVAISPNPANQYSKISFPNTIQSGSLIITDVLGKTVRSKQIVNMTEIAIGELPASGLYFYRLTDLINNQSYTGKFIY